MSHPSISIHNISKLYHLGMLHRQDTLRDTLAGLLRRNAQHLQTAENSIWALRDVSFEIEAGEVVGIIGRNGAGKSTLLKILSRITEPTVGRAVINGRVGSLLEVGTGFHPELSGRENIYLNGAILGMRRAEIDRRFDEIVVFAEIEKFLDTPVKRYSSGMYVRLAFAVAAHLETEVLLIDEVLAVGDVAFQRKCLGKMESVSRQGRTVLFVSHNMAAIQALCSRAVFIHQGAVQADGNTTEVVNAYLKTMEQMATTNLLQRVERRGKGDARITQIQILADGDLPKGLLVAGRHARFIFSTTKIKAGLSCTFTIYDQHGQPIVNLNSAVGSDGDKLGANQDRQFVCEMERLLLTPGRYRINAALNCSGELEDHIEAAAFFDVEPGQINGRPVTAGGGYGSAVFPCRWLLPGNTG